MPLSLAEVEDQAAALSRIRSLIDKGMKAQPIVRAARSIVADCDAKDDLCELQAIYDAVKNGTDLVPGMRRGLRYVADPRNVDWYQGAVATLRECAAGACSGDCDEHTVLVAALCGALGFKVGARAWGPKPGVKEYTHVYCVVCVPKRGGWTSEAKNVRGMDTTVSEAYVGWQPPRGEVLTDWGRE